MEVCKRTGCKDDELPVDIQIDVPVTAGLEGRRKSAIQIATWSLWE